jgi:MinD superfamily P-loop ATPase
MTRPTSEKLNVALSYVHEDEAIANAVVRMLRHAFDDALHTVLLGDSPAGTNLTENLIETIAAADILIPIFTDPTNATVTAFEIGTFVASLQSKPTIGPERQSERRLSAPWAPADGVSRR